VDNTVEASKELWKWLKTPTAKGILKCSLAYLLGSAATFLPPLANFLGRQDGKHVVATITVYFHPARSAGSMEEAALLGFGAFLYATFVGIASMATSVFFESQLDLIELGYALVLIVFCGGGLGFIGWFKQKYSAPLVNVACSLASLAIITILTKENAVQTGVFSNDKIVQVMKMVIMGILATSAVSLLVWPVSARTELRETMIKATDSFGDMLTMITHGFLSGSETDLRSTSFNKAQGRYKSVFTQLTKNLEEARFEHYVLGTEEEYKLEASLVYCMQRLAQSIGGLRSAATTQFTLLKESPDFGTPQMAGSPRPFPHVLGGPASSTLMGRHDRFAILTAIEEASEEGSGAEDHETENSQGPSQLERRATLVSVTSTGLPTARSPTEIFSRFILHLGPSMKSLAYTLSQILQELPFGDGPEYRIKINDQFKSSLTDAVYVTQRVRVTSSCLQLHRTLYTNARAEALMQLYKIKELDKDRPENVEADFEEVAASCGHFSFSLQDFAKEMQNYLSILEGLKEVTDKHNHSWNWLLFWKKSKHQLTQAPVEDPEQECLLEQQEGPEVPKDIPELVLEGPNARKWKVAEQGHDSTGDFYHRLLHIIRVLERDDGKLLYSIRCQLINH
jgi:hypothetical protein